MDLVVRYLGSTWAMVAELAPWLLVGFALAGLVSIALRRSVITRLLGKPGLGSIIRATLVGVPMPICSCGVIPVAAAIREKGAGKGATAAFLASTPETGVDSALATWGMLGPLMAAVRVVMAFVSGILAGLFVQLVSSKDDESNKSVEGGESVHSHNSDEERKTLKDAVYYAFIKMPRDMAPSLIVGILLAGAVTAFIPAGGLGFVGSSGVASYLLVTLVAIPLYVCSTGSIPLALAMIQAGFSPGSALVFLISGPATNTATIITMRRYLGSKAVGAYLFAIVLSSWGAGALVDAGLGKESILSQMPAHEASYGILAEVSGVILIALLLKGLYSRVVARVRLNQTSSHSSCCCHGAHASGLAHKNADDAGCCSSSPSECKEPAHNTDSSCKGSDSEGEGSCCCKGKH